MRFYIASKLENFQQVQYLHNCLVSEGHELTYDWTTHGPVWQQGRDRLEEVQGLELEGIRTADVVIALLPGGRGTHFELGYARGLDKRVLLVGPRELFVPSDATCAFYHGSSNILCSGGVDFDTVVRVIASFFQMSNAQLAAWQVHQKRDIR